MTQTRGPVGWGSRLGGVVVVALLVGGLAAAPAAAHIALRSSNPAADARVDQTPTEIELTFDEPAIAMGTRIVVTGPSGPVQTGAPRLADNTVTQTVLPGSPAGRYVVDWRVTSADGHPVTGTFVFTSVAAGPPPDWRLEEPAEPAPSTQATGSAVWIAVAAVAVLALLAVAIVALLAVRRRTHSDRRPGRPDDTIAARSPRDPVPTAAPNPERNEDDPDE